MKRLIAILTLALTVAALCACSMTAGKTDGSSANPTAVPAGAHGSAEVDTRPTAEPIPTPTPSPTPNVQSLEIRYAIEDRVLSDVTIAVGDELPLYAKILPSEITGEVEWRLDEAGSDAFQIIEDPDNPNHIKLRCVGRLPAGTGGVYIYAELYGQEAKCILRVR